MKYTGRIVTILVNSTLNAIIELIKRVSQLFFGLLGVTDPVVYVGVVEKGSATVEIAVDGVQGHSSKPPRESAIGILAKAVVSLVKLIFQLNLAYL